MFEKIIKSTVTEADLWAAAQIAGSDPAPALDRGGPLAKKGWPIHYTEADLRALAEHLHGPPP